MSRALPSAAKITGVTPWLPTEPDTRRDGEGSPVTPGFHLVEHMFLSSLVTCWFYTESITLEISLLLCGTFSSTPCVSGGLVSGQNYTTGTTVFCLWFPSLGLASIC